MNEHAAEDDRYGFLSSDGYPEEGPNPLIKPPPSTESDALATALCREYHPMHWDAAYGNRNRACGACKIHADSLIASGWCVVPPAGGDGS